METHKIILLKVMVEFHGGSDVLDFYQANQVVRVLSMRTGLSFQPPQQEPVSQLFGIWNTEAFDQVLISIPPTGKPEDSR